MFASGLFGQSIPHTRTRKRRKKTVRTQYRREPWEDATEPVLYHPGVSLFCGTGPAKVKPGPDKVEILAARHANKEALWNPQEKPGDVPTPPIEHAFNQMLLHHFISGVEEIHPTKWRAHPWDKDIKKHVHLGYFRYQEEAVLAVVKWRKRKQLENGDDESENDNW